MSVASLPAENPALRWLREVARQLFLPVLGIFTALVIGAIIIVASGFNPLSAYSELFQGAFGNLERINGTLAATTPYIFTTLAVVFAFRAGMFNIGAEGQFRIGAISAAWMGVSVGSWPFFLAVPLTLAAGWLGGAVWGAIPGTLKAYFGAHEVIITIMLNYIAGFITAYLVGAEGPLRGNRMTTTAPIGQNARIPTLVAYNGTTGTGSSDTPLHWGFIVALLVAGLIYWLLWRTPLGFEIRTVGLNPSAARYAGINIRRTLIIAMSGGGLLAGTAGALEVMGNPSVRYQYTQALGSGYGFNSIAIALLAKNNPLAAVPAALLFASLQSGAGQMQLKTQAFGAAAEANKQLPGDLISIIQALVIIFVAADQVIRWLYRMRAQQGQRVVLTRGWGKAE
jgi:simple sugar transport system permease protein